MSSTEGHDPIGVTSPSRPSWPIPALALIWPLAAVVPAQTLDLPPRPGDAPEGRAIVAEIRDLPREARERRIEEEILGGNVPESLRRLAPVTLASGEQTATVWVTPDFLAVGSDADHSLTPLTPGTAQRVADGLGCVLPTRKLVDAIWGAAEVRLAPSPIPPSDEMTTVAVFADHNATVRGQRAEHLAEHPLGALVDGHKKSVVITARLASLENRVAIYGWHRLNGEAIQPLYVGHVDTWVDYSHGIRLVQSEMTANGEPTTVEGVLGDPGLCGLVSDEGVIEDPRYPTE
jgi:hypothetical protein